MKSDFIGYATIENGKKIEVWLETGWDPERCSFILGVKFIDPDTKRIVSLKNIKDGLEALEIEKPKNRDISKEIEKLIKFLKR